VYKYDNKKLEVEDVFKLDIEEIRRDGICIDYASYNEDDLYGTG